MLEYDTKQIKRYEHNLKSAYGIPLDQLKTFLFFKIDDNDLA